MPWDMGIVSEDLAVTVVEYRSDRPTSYWFIADNRAQGNGYIYGSKNSLYNPPGTLLTPGFFVQTFSKSEYWQNGQRVGSAIGSGLIPKKDIRFFGRFTAVDPYAKSVIHGLFVHRRNSNNEEAAELCANPWQLFKADPVRIYSLPSGPITLGTPIISNITASGFRVSVGLT